jgi:hypothetical protein
LRIFNRGLKKFKLSIKTITMELLEFYDLNNKTWFSTREYEVTVNAKGMRIAKAVSPSGRMTVRILSRA